METCFDTFCDFCEFLGVLFLMLFFEAHFFEFEEFRAELFWGPGLTRETTSPAKDRMVETKNEIGRIS